MCCNISDEQKRAADVRIVLIEYDVYTNIEFSGLCMLMQRIRDLEDKTDIQRRQIKDLEEKVWICIHLTWILMFYMDSREWRWRWWRWWSPLSFSCVCMILLHVIQFPVLSSFSFLSFQFLFLFLFFSLAFILWPWCLRHLSLHRWVQDLLMFSELMILDWKRLDHVAASALRMAFVFSFTSHFFIVKICFSWNESACLHLYRIAVACTCSFPVAVTQGVIVALLFYLCGSGTFRVPDSSETLHWIDFWISETHRYKRN